MTAFWEGLGRSARAGLIAGAIAIVVLTAALAWWLMRPDYQVLFSDLKPQDAAAMSAELDKLKIPYRFDEGNGSILVDRPQVHATRIRLMGKDMPLHGAVGFELFNNTDFGMTEFAQKINYQRALQGELTRTILSLAEIRDVRVHLALPEQGLFKQANARPKAAITLTLKEGRALRPEQVSGIQRLVAAATPGMTAQDVTVVDRQGMALSRPADDVVEGGAAGGSGRLELKKDTEAQLARKAATVLDRMFGTGQAMASVDVTLNMDQVRITTEDVIPAPSRSADSRGVIVKERESVRDGGQAPLDAARSGAAGGASTQREVDYQVGRRVEQVVSQAGAVRRIQVVAVVRQALDGAQEDKLRRLLAAAVGANTERGDLVVVQSMSGLLPSADPGAGTAARGPANGDAGGLTADVREEIVSDADPGAARSPDGFWWNDLRVVAGCVAALLLAAAAVQWFRGRPQARGTPTQRLSVAEREDALRKVRDWMQSGTASAEAQTAPGGPVSAGRPRP